MYQLKTSVRSDILLGVADIPKLYNSAPLWHTVAASEFDIALCPAEQILTMSTFQTTSV